MYEYRIMKETEWMFKWNDLLYFAAISRGIFISTLRLQNTNVTK